MTKKLLALLLCLLLLVGMLPAAAFAADAAPTVQYNGSSSVTAVKVGTCSQTLEEGEDPIPGDVYLATLPAGAAVTAINGCSAEIPPVYISQSENLLAIPAEADYLADSDFERVSLGNRYNTLLNYTGEVPQSNVKGFAALCFDESLEGIFYLIVQIQQETTPQVIGSVTVVVENNTYKTAAGAPWSGELLRVTVPLTTAGTMMTCVAAALEGEGVEVEGIENNYITSIGGLAAFDGGDESGWMGTLNDWFVNEGFDGITAKDGELCDGDIINVMYTCSGCGADLGGSWSDKDKTLKALAFSQGVLAPAFDKDTHSYTLNVAEDVEEVLVTPTASNKNFQVRTYVGDTEYKRTQSIPVTDGMVITVKDGDPAWPTMNEAAEVPAEVYTVTVQVQAQVEDPVVDSGNYQNIDWSLTQGGVLTLSAKEGTNGAMGYYSTWSPVAWVKNHNADIKKVVVAEGVTTVSNSFLNGCTAVESVSLPASMTSLAAEPFYGINSGFTVTIAAGGNYSVSGNFILKDSGKTIALVISTAALTGTVTVPDGVTAIGTIFKGTGISGIVLPSSVTAIPNNAFQNCSSLTSVSIPSSVTAIGDYAFQNCSSLTSVTIPSSVTSIGTYAFSGCSSLPEITIPGSVTTIGKYACYNCAKLASVTIGEGTTTISGYAFRNCPALTTVSVPASVTDLAFSSFKDCGALTNLTFAQGSCYTITDGTVSRGTELCYMLPGAVTENLVIPSGVTAIGGYAFFGNKTLKEVTLPEGLLTIGASAFDGCSSLTKADIPSTVTTIKNDAFYDTAITSAVIPEGVTAIESNTFYGCTKLASVTIPNGVTSIGGSAFYNCSSLQSVSLPASVTSIGQKAFSGAGITELTTGAALNSYAFSNCSKLKTVTLTEGVISLPSNAFQNCTALETVNLPASLASLDVTAFSGCTALKTVNFAQGGTYSGSNGLVIKGTELVMALPTVSGAVVIPDGVTAIADNAFKANKAITSVTLPEGLLSIGYRAFYQCSGLSGQLTFPASLKTIDDGAFYQCIGLTGTLTIPATVTYIGNSSFNSCSGLSSVIMETPADPDAVTYGSQIFYKCTGLTSATLPANLKTYDQIFYGCSKLTALELPATLTSLGSMSAFTGMSSLERLVLPAGVTALPSLSFNSCSSLTYIDASGVINGNILSGATNVRVLVLGTALTSFETYAAYAPQYILYAGTQEQWNQVTISDSTKTALEEKGTVILFNVDTQTAGTAPVFTAQPQSATIRQGVDSAELTVSLSGTDSADALLYYWYKTENGVTTALKDKTASITVASSAAGSVEYYCVVEMIQDGKIGRAQSAAATITVTEFTPEAAFSGTGTQEDPYLIATAEDLDNLRAFVNSGTSFAGQLVRLTADITLPDGWTPIGCTKDGTANIQSGSNLNVFAGTLDGDGHTVTVPKGGLPLIGYVKGTTVKNLKIYGEEIAGYGLVNNFEGVGLSGTTVTLDNITLVSGTKTLKSGLLGGNITTSGYAANSAGVQAVVSNCTVEQGCVIGYTGTEKFIGSIAGRMQGTITGCVSYAEVKGSDYVGGIVATRDNAMGDVKVENCAFHGTVTGTRNVGGIVGGGYENSTAPNGIRMSVNNNICDGTVTGETNVGGIFGGDEFTAQAWNAYTFKNNTFTGTITGETNVGAIIGFYDSLNSYDDISGNTYRYGSAEKGIGAVRYLDTSAENPTVPEGTTCFSTASGTSACPSVTGCSWKTGLNRTDDPLGADADKLCASLPNYGDVDDNGTIDLRDVSMLYRGYIGKSVLTEKQKAAGDVNLDKTINLRDVAAIYRAYTSGAKLPVA